jgi:hypothetical protein
LAVFRGKAAAAALRVVFEHRVWRDPALCADIGVELLDVVFGHEPDYPGFRVVPGDEIPGHHDFGVLFRVEDPLKFPGTRRSSPASGSKARLYSSVTTISFTLSCPKAGPEKMREASKKIRNVGRLVLRIVE